MPDLRGLILTGGGESDPEALALLGGPAWTLPVANRPLLAHAIAGLRSAGARRTIVAGAQVPLGRGLTPLELDPGTGIAGALAAAASDLGGAPVLVHRADGFVVGARMPEAPVGLGAVLVAPEGADPDRAPAVVIGPGAAEVAALLPPEAGIAALLDALVRAGGEVAVHTLPGAWRYGGRADCLLEANRLVLDALERRVSDADLSTARIEGRVSVHPTAVVERATVRGPAIIGAGASVVDSFVGPYTAIGDRVELDGAEVENSILSPGVRVRHVGTRIEASVIGPDATIERDFGLPAAMRVRVGRGAQVTVG
jgi:glucose-1-phosphate thymidylyltransferase